MYLHCIYLCDYTIREILAFWIGSTFIIGDDLAAITEHDISKFGNVAWTAGMVIWIPSMFLIDFQKRRKMKLKKNERKSLFTSKILESIS